MKTTNCKEKDKIHFYNVSGLQKTPKMETRANADYISEKLALMFPSEKITVESVGINETGKYKKRFSSICNLPSYCEVKLAHSTGEHTETIIIWSPFAWNGGFIGTGGGGTGTGGANYIVKPNNTQRGQNLAFAICNGFTAATTDAANVMNEWAFENDEHTFDWERYENWRASSTHFMTVIGKAVANLLHERPVQYAYFHGGSGGGRQAMVEAQEFPQDYNGIWASCPAINWTKFVCMGIWAIALMNEAGHIIPPRKMEYFMQAAQNSVGGAKEYYQYFDAIQFDPFTVVGHKTKDGDITQQDAAIMRKIWQGATDENGEFLWYGFRPGVHFWNVAIPIGAFYYSLPFHKPKPFIIATLYLRWVTKNPEQTFDTVTLHEFYGLFEKSTREFKSAAADNADLSAFANCGGKLIIDHGIDDPLIPVDGTIDYFNHICKLMGRPAVNDFCRLYITPGDGHGNCNFHGPGITETDGMAALIQWVEQGTAPSVLRVIQVDKTGHTVCEKTQLNFEV